ncbi:YbaN family protein [Parvularcula marina]|uniref:YbaN family protein n=1 Tax=Parvularcula marina TaxID=2292771 RepID=UPI0035143668
MTPKRALWLLLGMVAVGLGAVGVVLPLLPTTPFLLLAAFAFARSSERWHQWLVNHQIFGPLIEDWNRYGAISRSAKTVSVLSMLAVVLISVTLKVPALVLAVQAVVLMMVAIFVLSRPSPPSMDD